MERFQDMGEMNQKQQLLNPQERSEVTNIKVHQSLYELLSSLINYFKLPHQDRLIQENKDKWRGLNWVCACFMPIKENLGREEYNAVRKILKTQTELLQQDYNQGRDTSRQRLMVLLRFLWKYFVLNSQRRPALTPNFASLNNHREWEKFHQTILRLSTNLQQNILEIAMEQDVEMIIYHLKESTTARKTQDSIHAEVQQLDILETHPEL